MAQQPQPPPQRPPLPNFNRMNQAFQIITQECSRFYTRSYYRSVNSCVTGENEDIIALPDFQNAYPNPFPTNVQSLRDLPGQNLDTLLAFYGLQVIGGLDARQKRLAEYLGIKLL